MNTEELEKLPNARLFSLCAAYTEGSLEGDQYWAEFSKRFHKCLTNAIYLTYARLSEGYYPQASIIADITQEIYFRLYRNNSSSLRNFQGETDLEAWAYLANIATNMTADYLRRERSKKRKVWLESLEFVLQTEESKNRDQNPDNTFTDEVVEREFIELLHKTFKGRNSERDIHLFILYHFIGYSLNELANIFKLKPTSIAHTLTRMRSKLKRQMR